jgi:hypothetical protein
MLSLDSISFSKIYERLSHNYVTNIDYYSFLQKNQYKILLDKYICVMYGNTDQNVRKIQFVHFINGFFVSKSKISYHVYIYEQNQFFWVQDTLTLRRKFFDFVDKTSLLRTCFLYDIETEEIYRLQELRYNLYLPFQTPKEERIYKNKEEFIVFCPSKKEKKNEYEEGTYYPIICEERKKQICKKMAQKLEQITKSIEEIEK